MPVPPFILALRARLGHDLLLLPGVCALVFNDAGHILLQRRTDTGRWSVIGGILEPGEEPADALVREVWEETGLRVSPVRITGVYTTPVTLYPNGDQAQYVLTVFACKVLEGHPHVHDDESLEVAFFPIDALPADVPEHQRLRIRDALNANTAAHFTPAKGVK